MSLLLLTNKTKKNKQTSKQNDYMAPFYGAAVYRHGKMHSDEVHLKNKKIPFLVIIFYCLHVLQFGR